MLTVYCKKIIIKLSNDKGMNIMNIAILYQVKEPPQVGNIRKPMKEGGYSDSGSDLAYELKKNGYNLITPVENPNEKNNIDWVFGDDDEGITKAINMGLILVFLLCSINRNLNYNGLCKYTISTNCIPLS